MELAGRPWLTGAALSPQAPWGKAIPCPPEGEDASLRVASSPSAPRTHPQASSCGSGTRGLPSQLLAAQKWWWGLPEGRSQALLRGAWQERTEERAGRKAGTKQELRKEGAWPEEPQGRSQAELREEAKEQGLFWSLREVTA